MNEPILFRQEQLAWLEELNPNYFVKVRFQEKGDGELDKERGVEQVIPLKELSDFKSTYTEKNLWRSWAIFRDAAVLDEIGPVPLILDIDNSKDLEPAYTSTKFCLDLLEKQSEWAGSFERLRVIFSGKKGFHIEVKPRKPIEAGKMREELLEICNAKFQNTGNMLIDENTYLDPFHCWVRLTGTLYSWYSENDELIIRRILQMSPQEFHAKNIEDILQEASNITPKSIYKK